MEKLLQTFKNLYVGEAIVKRHFYVVLMLLLPALALAIASVIDKDVPTLIVAKLLIISTVLLILSIIPFLILSGFGLDFLKLRLESGIGLPSVTWESLPKGLKAIPLYVVWGFYYSVFAIILFSVPVAIFAYSLTLIKEHLAIFILLVLLSVILACISALLSYVILPFIGFIYIKFSDTFEYCKALFNPMQVVYYVKKAFKSTVIVFFKYILVNLVLSTVVSIIVSIFGLFIFAYILIMSTMSTSDNIYTPAFLLMLIIPSWIASIFQVYVLTIPGYAMADNMVEIYKNEIVEQ